MRTAQNHRRNGHRLIGPQNFPQIRFQLRTVHPPLLHALYDAGGREPVDFRPVLIGFHLPVEFLFPQGHLRGHDQHMGVVVFQYRRFQGRFDAHHGNLIVPLPQQVNGRRRGRIAGHHQRLAPGVQQPFRRRKGQLLHRFRGPRTIGGVGRISKI